MSGDNTVFVYGTLMEPRVFFRVVQGQPRPPSAIQALYTFTPAVLQDYCRHRVQGEDYPGIVPEPGKSVRGVYVTGLTEANIAKLDQFEGDEYERLPIAVRLDGKGGAEAKADDAPSTATTAYVFISPQRIERGEWDFEHFRKEKLQYWARDEIFFADDGVDDEAFGDETNDTLEEAKRSAV